MRNWTKALNKFTNTLNILAYSVEVLNKTIKKFGLDKKKHVKYWKRKYKYHK